MRTYLSFLAGTALILVSCSTIPKSYFTPEVRTRVESKAISLTQLQYYIDRDVELRRELATGETKVVSGKIKFENGKYLNIIRLKKFTEGVCTSVNNGNTLQVSFETGDGKSLKFGVRPNAGPEKAYQIVSNELVKDNSYVIAGKVEYEGQTYMIQPNGMAARLMIQKSVVDKTDVKQRTMKGRKVNS